MHEEIQGGSYRFLNRLCNEGCQLQISKKNELEEKIINAVRVLLIDEAIENLAKKINQQLQHDNGQTILKVYESQLEKTKSLISKLLIYLLRIETLI